MRILKRIFGKEKKETGTVVNDYYRTRLNAINKIYDLFLINAENLNITNIGNLHKIIIDLKSSFIAKKNSILLKNKVKEQEELKFVEEAIKTLCKIDTICSYIQTHHMVPSEKEFDDLSRDIKNLEGLLP